MNDHQEHDSRFAWNMAVIFVGLALLLGGLVSLAIHGTSDLCRAQDAQNVAPADK